MENSSHIAWPAHWEGLARRYGDRVAVRDISGPLRYADLHAGAVHIARRLLARNLPPDARVLTWMPNKREAAIAALGALLTGVADGAASPHATVPEVEKFARASGADLILTTDERAREVAFADTMAIALASPQRVDPNGPRGRNARAAAIGRILFSSGTTGPAKAFAYTHAARWTGHLLQRATLPFVPQPGSRLLVMTPFSHGASLLSFAWWDYGGEVLLHDGVEPERVAEALEAGVEALEAGVDALFAPPTVIAKLAAHFGKRRFAGVRAVFVGTQILTPRLHEAAVSMFGPVLRVAYGKSECINPIATLSGSDVTQAFGTASPDAGGTCVGWPAPGVELAVRDVDSTILPAATPGEVWLRAEHMSAGQIIESRIVPWEPDGWHRTGDRGWLDSHGRLWLAGRMNDAIKTGGHLVQLEDLDSLLDDIAGIQAAAAFSIPSEYWGDILAVAAEGAMPGWENEIRIRFANRSKYMHPRLFVALPSLPRNAQGKVVRRLIRETVLRMYRLRDGAHPELVRTASHAADAGQYEM